MGTGGTETMYSEFQSGREQKLSLRSAKVLRVFGFTLLQGKTRKHTTHKSNVLCSSHARIHQIFVITKDLYLGALRIGSLKSHPGDVACTHFGNTKVQLTHCIPIYISAASTRQSSSSESWHHEFIY